MKLLAALAALLFFSGCASMRNQQALLYAPAPINDATMAPSMDAYRAALAAAQRDYTAALSGKATPDEMLDAGIGAANKACRDWFARVSESERRYKLGEANTSVAMQAITAALGLGGANQAIVAGYGIATSAITGWNGAFEQAVLAPPSNHAAEIKIREIMGQRAEDLRAAGGWTFPRAFDALEEYAALCSFRMVRAATDDALRSTTTTVQRTGALVTVQKAPQ